MLKMRQWQGTLERVRAVQRHRDVAIDGSIEVISQQNHQSIDGLDSKQTHCRNGSQPQMGISAVNSCRQPDLADVVNKEYNDVDDEVKFFLNFDYFYSKLSIVNLWSRCTKNIYGP